MLEKPQLADEELAACLQADFNLDINEITFLPLGSDVNTAAYRALATDGSSYFVKLRREARHGLHVRVPQTLHEQGIKAVIPPIPTRSGALWARLNEFNVSLAPFINGATGFDRDLSDDNWVALGRALNGVHSAKLSHNLREQLPREDFSGAWRRLVRTFQNLSANDDLPDAVAARLVALMEEKREVISELVAWSDRLALDLQNRNLEMVPCHADIHGGNVLINPDEDLYIVDWDTFMLAPKERDLMFIGGGIGPGWQGERPARCFYQGYGPAEIDLTLIAYYRCERIVVDFAEFGKALLLTSEGGDDREQSLHYFASNFQPGATIDLALESLRSAGG